MVSVRLAAYGLSRRGGDRLAGTCRVRVLLIVIMVVIIMLSTSGSSSVGISTSSLAMPVVAMRFTANRLSRRGSLSHDGGKEAQKGDGESGGLHLEVLSRRICGGKRYSEVKM